MEKIRIRSLKGGKHCHHVDIRANMKKVTRCVTSSRDLLFVPTTATLVRQRSNLRAGERRFQYLLSCIMPKRRSSHTLSEAERNSEDGAFSLSDSDATGGKSAPKKSNGLKRSCRKQPRVDKKRKTEDQRQEPYPGIPKITDSTHSESRHSIQAVGSLRSALLEWYATVHDLRSMPWRKPPGNYQTLEQRSQRAYEVTGTYHVYTDILTLRIRCGFRK
jgi:hypothetical protein